MLGNFDPRATDPLYTTALPGVQSQGFDLASLATLDNLQTSLDVLGLVPGIGIGADLANAGISAFRGDWVGVGLGLAAAVPVLGTAVATTKLANRTTRVYQIWDTKLNTVYKYGISSGALRKNGILPRLDNQLRALENTYGHGRFYGTVLNTYSSRARALYFEKVHTAIFKNTTGRLPAGMKRPGGEFPSGYPTLR